MLVDMSENYMYVASNIESLVAVSFQKGHMCFGMGGDFLLSLKMVQRICIQFYNKNIIRVVLF